VLLGALQKSVMDWFAVVAPSPDGAPGVVNGVLANDGVEGAELPTAVVAITLKVYAVPFVSPVTVHDVADPAEVHVAPPGDALTL